ncbi:MAG TPA: NAD(P)-dependent oxidoreductase [Nitrospirota bacterium]
MIAIPKMQSADSGRVFVTGGTGFVGSHLVEFLLKKGFSVTCLVRNPERLRWLAGLNVRLMTGDCSAPESLAPAVRNHSIVFHAAGLTKAIQARDYYETNYAGTKNLLAACSQNNPGLQKFILVSSLAAAGPSPDGRPVTDKDPARPVSDYGRSKLCAEEETLRWKDRFPVVILRPSAVYGPRDTDMYELFRWAVKGLTMEISGGERFINPCYVEDLAEALFLAAEREVPSGSIFFIAESKAYSWSEFRRALLATGGVHARNITVPYWAAYLIGLANETGGLLRGKALITNRQKVREAAQKYWICDTQKSEHALGFTPKFTLERGLEATWKWYREKGWL